MCCDRFELPDAFAPFTRTRELDEQTIPAGLQRDHTTARGVWNVIHVVSGRLRDLLEPPLAGEHLLDREHEGIVVPEVRHRVAPDGPVRFFVELYRRSAP